MRIVAIFVVALVVYLQGCDNPARETMSVLSGKVVDSISSTPLAGTKVYVGDTVGVPNVITDTTGEFNIGIFGYTATLTATCNGFISKTKNVDARVQAKGITFQLVSK